MTDLIEKEENMMEEYTKEDCGREDEHKRRWKERKLEERSARQINEKE